MKIESSNHAHLFARQSGKGDAPKAWETSSNKDGDMERLQREAKEIGSLLQYFRFEETFREDKVEAIRKQVEAGTYQISGKQVVDRLMGEG